jgi:hypothetical protein
MKAIADQEGKIHIVVPLGDDASATFAITSDGGVPFAPGQDVEIDDARLQRVIDQLLAPFRTRRCRSPKAHEHR